MDNETNNKATNNKATGKKATGNKDSNTRIRTSRYAKANARLLTDPLKLPLRQRVWGFHGRRALEAFRKYKEPEGQEMTTSQPHTIKQKNEKTRKADQGKASSRRDRVKNKIQQAMRRTRRERIKRRERNTWHAHLLTAIGSFFGVLGLGLLLDLAIHVNPTAGFAGVGCLFASGVCFYWRVVSHAAASTQRETSQLEKLLEHYA